MTEPEIDSLMQGQEDENGSIHYEGVCLEIPFFFNPSLLKMKRLYWNLWFL